MIVSSQSRLEISDSFDNLGDKGHRWYDIYIHPSYLQDPEDEQDTVVQ